MPLNLMETECLGKCKSQHCVDDLNAVIIKGTSSQVKAYVKTYCPAALHNRDSFGRNPLHIAASCGKVDIVSWLIETCNCDIDKPDRESGWTALHRALYNGRIVCAVFLVKKGANFWLRDREGLTACDLSSMDVAPWMKHISYPRTETLLPSGLHVSDRSEVFVWGSNNNHTLAKSHSTNLKLPEELEYFTKKGLFIKQVAISKYHSLFVTSDGAVYSCGQGEGGRLGNGNQDVSMEPKKVLLADGIIVKCVAAADNHSVFVTECGKLLTCGLNKHSVLGIDRAGTKQLTPALVTSIQAHKIIGCSTGKCHTVAWTTDSVFTMGWNAGQLGHQKHDAIVPNLRLVSSLQRKNDVVMCAHACDVATVVATQQGNVYLLHNYSCRRIVSKQLDIIKVQVGGGHLEVKQTNDIDCHDNRLSVVMLKKSGDILMWNKSYNTIDRCAFDLPHVSVFKDLCLCGAGNTLLLVSNTGHAYTGVYGNRKAASRSRKSSSANIQEYRSSLALLNSDSVQYIHLDELGCVFRAHSCAIGPKAHTFSVLQSQPKSFITDAPVIDPSLMSEQLGRVLNDANEINIIYDIIITSLCGDNRKQSFHCHQYILANRSPTLRKFMIQQVLEESKKPSDSRLQLYVQNVEGVILDNTIKYLYTGNCDLLKEGFDVPKLPQENYHDIKLSRDKPTGIITNENENFSNSNSSAFEVYSKQPSPIATGKTTNHNALSQFKTFAKFLGVKIPNIDEYVISKDNLIEFSKKKNKISLDSFNRDDVNFSDIIFKCEDGVEVKAHKCVLVARCAYFHRMLTNPWVESDDTNTTLNLAIPSDILKLVLKFLYTDSKYVLTDITSIELVCEVMAAADHLLLDRLKQVAEAQVSSMLTLRNVSSVVEVSLMFNCNQLMRTCCQFITYHFPALLHTPAFYTLQVDDTSIDDQYRRYIEDVYNRVIYCHYTCPDLSALPLHADDDDVITTKAIPTPTKPTKPNRNKSLKGTKMMPGTTLSEILNRKVKDEDTLENRIASSNQSKNILHPQRETTAKEDEIDLSPTITEAPKTITNDKYKTPVANDNPLPKKMTEPNKTFVSPPVSRVDFRQLLRGEELLLEKNKSMQHPEHKLRVVGRKKLSQKQRKLLEAEQRNALPIQEIEPTVTPISNVWGGNTVKKPAASFWEMSKQQQKDEELNTIATSPLKLRSPTKPFATSPPFDNSSPWQNRLGSQPQTTVSVSANLREIIHLQQADVEKEHRTKNKPLTVIQIEDRAMIELKEYYAKNLPSFQTVTVQRRAR